MIGRNEPCLCGSGRKYKKCCEKKENMLEKVLESELMGLQVDIMRFAYDKYATELQEVSSRYITRFSFDEMKAEAYQELLHLWYIFTVKLKNEKSIFEEYVSTNQEKFQRSQLRDWAESWQGASPSVYKVANIRGEMYTMEDFFTKDKVKVTYIGREDKLQKNELVVGMFVPYQQANVVFMSTFERGTLEAIRIEEMLQEMEGDWNKNSFPELAGRVIEFELREEDVQDLPVQDEAQEQVLALLTEASAKRKYPKKLLQFTQTLWSIYCMKESPSIRNSQNYAAAMIYFLDSHFMKEQVETQKALSEEFGVSPGSVSSTYRKLEEVLQPVLETFADDIETAFNAS
ncbi:hypothetical protein FIU87_18855 [Bacillus sp. THAF10]|uniref:SEC-C metal-binding domain-containing protein n=1 Tax=Bacillus sp. THAF10 TaxID=2587848 RepID=UPI00126965E5|nr:SEC-C metal-binding domain-containing protein [Bacillus sp. THAF10]QFT90709.1 hypothetical protein FIU87_18855 [Bacillus sp. THAF10]